MSADWRAACLRRGTFHLSAGGTSDTYFDTSHLLADPALLLSAAASIALPAGCEVLAAVADAAVPVAVALSLSRGLPLAIVRKAPKGHGADPDRRVVGAPVRGRRVAVIENVVTSGASLASARAALEAAGAIVVGECALIDRRPEGAG